MSFFRKRKFSFVKLISKLFTKNRRKSVCCVCSWPRRATVFQQSVLQIALRKKHLSTTASCQRAVVFRYPCFLYVDSTTFAKEDF